MRDDAVDDRERDHREEERDQEARGVESALEHPAGEAEVLAQVDGEAAHDGRRKRERDQEPEAEDEEDVEGLTPQRRALTLRAPNDGERVPHSAHPVSYTHLRA